MLHSCDNSGDNVTHAHIHDNSYTASQMPESKILCKLVSLKKLTLFKASVNNNN